MKNNRVRKYQQPDKIEPVEIDDTFLCPYSSLKKKEQAKSNEIDDDCLICIEVIPVRMEISDPIPEKEYILEYLRKGRHPSCAPMMYRDRETGEYAVEAYYLNDGKYTWSSDTIYHFDKYNYPLPEEFIQYVLSVTNGSK